MGKSYKKNPISGITCVDSEKEFKQIEHRRERRAVKSLLKNKIENLPHKKKFGNPWNGTKDGKNRFDPKKFPKEMRK